MLGPANQPTTTYPAPPGGEARGRGREGKEQAGAKTEEKWGITAESSGVREQGTGWESKGHQASKSTQKKGHQQEKDQAVKKTQATKPGVVKAGTKITREAS